MAIKKSDMDSSLYQLCDELRGGMDPSQYKDYVLTLVFVKYITDKFLGMKYAPIKIPEGCSFEDFKALRNTANIGEDIDKALAKLANHPDNQKMLGGMFKDVHFNDEAKIGKGEEMVKKLTKLINIFCRPEFDFSKNKASGDDILGDVYENLMKHFAVDSGKSKGQFYTPAEASRVLAGVLGISDIKPKEDEADGWTICDWACGSGSLLIRAAHEAGCEVAIYGQELNQTTAALCKMNMVLHGQAEAEIYVGNTFSDPQLTHVEDGKEVLLKYWTDTMSDDVYLIVDDGFAAGREIDIFYKETTNKKTGKIKKTQTGWDGRLIARSLLDARFFETEAAAVRDDEAKLEAAKAAIEEFEEGLEEDADADADATAAKMKSLEKAKKLAAKKLADAAEKLEQLEREKYPQLTDEELQSLIVEDKWLATVKAGIDDIYTAVSNRLSERIGVLASRYAEALPELDREGEALETEVLESLKEMGY